MKNIFEPVVTNEIIARLNKLNPETKGVWGKMSVAQMLAHCNVTYELVYDGLHPKPKGIMKYILKWFVKKVVVSEKPYKHNSQTAPIFIISDEKEFEKERNRLINYLNKTLQLGEAYFDNRKSHSFGPLTKKEWSNMFYKHLDHHLTQFGV